MADLGLLPIVMVVFMVCSALCLAHDAVWLLRIGRVVKRGLVGVAGGVMVESPPLLESAIFCRGEDRKKQV